MKKYVIITIAVIQKCLSGFKNLLKYNPGEKSLKASFSICLNLKSLLKKEQTHQNNNNNNDTNNNLAKSYTEKKVKHGPSGSTVFTKFSFDEKENKLHYCRKKDCIEKLCKKFKKRAKKIINYEKKTR